MRYRLIVSLALITGAANVGASEFEAAPLLWCPPAKTIDLATCESTAPRDASGRVPLLKVGDCLGEPGDTKARPRCTTFTLEDAQRGTPLQGDCRVTAHSRNGSITMVDHLNDGVVAGPLWTDHIGISCPGYVDTELNAAEGPRQVALLPGREISVLLMPAEGGNPKGEETGHLTLHNTETASDTTRDIAIHLRTSVGSLALGTYAVAVKAKGYAPIVDTFQLTAETHPLELQFPLRPARCVPIIATCRTCGPAPLQYTLKRLSDSKGPIDYGTGNLQLKGDATTGWLGKICDVADGAYDLKLAGPGLTPTSQPITVDAAETSVRVDLRSGIPSRVTLVDTDGLPVANAKARVFWRYRGKPQEEETRSDATGDLQLPPFPANTEFRALISHEKYIPEKLRGLAGDDRVILMRPRGAILATIGGDGCTPDARVIATVKRRTDNSYKSEPQRFSPDKCRFEMPLEHPGTFDVTFHGPGLIAKHDVVIVGESEQKDIGTIDLERGRDFRVLVTHEERPVPGAQVKVGRQGVPVTTDSAGFADFHSLPPDQPPEAQTEFFVDHPSFAPRRVLRRVEAEEVVEIEVAVGAEVYGTVLSDDGLPAAGETIYAGLPHGYTFSSTVSGTGSYRIARLEPGKWLIWRMKTFSSYGAAGSGFGSGESRTVLLSDGDKKRIDFVPSVEVQGRVYIRGEIVNRPITFGAVLMDQGDGAAIPINVDAAGMYHTRLPGPGNWVFYYGQLSSVHEIAGCPCEIDVTFVEP